MAGKRQTPRSWSCDETLLQPLFGTVGRRVVHEEADEARRVTRHRFGDRRSVARDARDQRGARDALSIELGDPAIREAGDAAGRLPSERAAIASAPRPSAGQQLEKA